MSDLQCAATLHVARHGDAEYDVQGMITDEGGWLSELGREQVRALAERLAADPAVAVGAVYSSTLERAVESGELAASVLGLENTVVAGLQEYSVGDLVGRRYSDPDVAVVFEAWLNGDLDASFPGAEDGHQVLARVRAALEEIVDANRGRHVLVFSHGGVMSLVLPRLAQNVRDDLARKNFLPNAVPAVVRADADGWVVDSWPGTTDPRSV